MAKTQTKPMVIYSQVEFYNKVFVTWNIIRKWTDTSTGSEVSRLEAAQCIEEFDLPLLVHDENGKIWADPCNNPLLQIKERNNVEDPVLREKLCKQYKRVLQNLG